MAETNITFIKGDKHGSETDYRDALPVNMLAVHRPMYGAQGYMLQAPGLVVHGSGSGIDRGGIWNESHEIHYRVSGNDLISVDSAGASTPLGTVPGSDTVSLPNSFNTQGIVADGSFYLYDSTNGFRQVTDPDIRSPIDCVWVDGFYFFTDGDFLYHTEQSSEESIDPLDIAVAEFMPDKSLGLGKTSDNKVVVFGRYTTEYFVNVATDDFAFQRVPNRASKAGIVGTHAKCELNGVWYFLGGRKKQDISFYQLTIGDPERFATREVEKLINQYTEIELQNVVVEPRGGAQDGDSLVIIHLPNETLVFNETIAKKVGIDYAWSILKTGKGSDEWRAKHGIYEPRLGKWVYGDKIDSTLGLLSHDVATLYGDIAEWYLYSPFLYLDSASIDELELETIPGFNSVDDASVFVSLIYDGVIPGNEWIEKYGAPMVYDKRFIVRRLGYVRDKVGIILRGATRSRMAFHRAKIKYG